MTLIKERKVGIHTAAFLAALVIVPFVCRSAPAAERPTTGEFSEIARAMNEFSSELYTTLADPDKNTTVSPYSVYGVLSMVYAGARGGTAAEIAKVLRAPDDTKFHAMVSGLDRTIRSQSGGVQLNTANAVWAKKGFALQDAFLELLKSIHGGVVKQLDFGGNPMGSAEEINSWVAAHTKDRIKNLVDGANFDALTALVLTNAVYFKGKWLTPFEKTHTRPGEFTLRNGSKITVPMMSNTAHFPYAKGNGYQALEMPYEGDKVSMLIVLPDRHDQLSETIEELRSGTPPLWARGLSSQQVKVTIPRYHDEGDYNLIPALSRMGMADAFNSAKANFKGISETIPLYISRAKHKTFVDVDEEGTEAAAASSVEMRAMAMRRIEKIIEFRADRPFLYFLRHNGTGTILFTGHVAQPVQSSADTRTAPATRRAK